MALYSSPQSTRTSYLFVDGDNLRQTAQKISDRSFGGQIIPINWNKLRGHHRKVFYYDAIPVQQYQEDDSTYFSRVAPKRVELAAIERHAGYHVRSGDAVHRKRRGNEQKMVDVQLAVDALLMASRRLYDSMTLITGDLDFKPLISALVDMGVDVHLHYPIGETSEDLQAAADIADPINFMSSLNWIDEAFLSAQGLPQTLINLKDNGYIGHADLVAWDDSRYGHCRVLQSGSDFKLITELDPSYPQTHRLEVTGSRPEMIRTYTREAFGLDVPTW